MFAVYFPGATGYSQTHFHAAGLADLLDDVAPSFSDVMPGPDGGKGVAASWIGRPILAGEFEWTSVRRGAFWLGKGAGLKLSPDHFARQRRQLGADVTLADGQQWHFPIARQLPCVLGLDDAGNLTSEIVPLYRKFWDEAWQTTEWFLPDDSGVCHVDFKACFEFVCLALSINYRVNRDVASWLKLVRSDVCWPVAEVVTDGLWSSGAQKKTPADAVPSTSAGNGG